MNDYLKVLLLLDESILVFTKSKNFSSRDRSLILLTLNGFRNILNDFIDKEMALMGAELENAKH